MGFLERPFRITEKEKELLLSVSPSTIDRILKQDKKKLALKGKSGTKPGKFLKKQIPVRTYYADADKKPDFFEIDTADFSPTPLRNIGFRGVLPHFNRHRRVFRMG